MQLTCLTYEQLSSYTDNTINLSEKESLYKHISQCELCSCAVNGFAAMPFTENELVAINQIVDVKSNASASNSLTLAQVFIAVLSIGSIFGIWMTKDLEGKTGRQLIAAALSVYGTRTTVSSIF